MKTFLLPQHAEWRRANLHCHTVNSDGRLTPEEVKKLYMSRGYSIVAYTDHERFIPHPELCDRDFLAMNSAEYGIGFGDFGRLPDPPGIKGNWTLERCYHFNVFAKRSDIDEGQVMKAMSRTIRAAQRKNFDGTDEERAEAAKFSYAKVNDLIAKWNEAGLLVQLNHPYWSLNSVEDCVALDGLWSLEILNWATVRETGADYVPYIYDRMLWRHGPSLFCTMADDNHNPTCWPPEEHSFGGSTFFASDELSHEAVADAMARGDFFCASGVYPPRFTGLWVEDGKVHVECSPVSDVIYTAYGRVYRQIRGAGITSAEFSIGADDPYFRITLIDGAGNYGHTNAYAVRDEWRPPKE
jgi:hypothetical protein